MNYQIPKKPREMDQDHSGKSPTITASIQNLSKGFSHQSGSDSNIPSDVMGSYTGTADDGDLPVQDVDDL